MPAATTCRTHLANCGDHTDRRVIQCQLPGQTGSASGFRTVYAFSHDSLAAPMYDSAAHPAVAIGVGGLLLDGSITAPVHTVDLPDDGIHGADSVIMIAGRFVYFFFKDDHNSSISEFIHYHAHPVLEDGALAMHSSLCDETGMDGYPHAPPGPPSHPRPPSVPPGNVSDVFITTPELEPST